MSLKRTIRRLIRSCKDNWIVFAMLGFLFLFFIVRLVLYVPPPKIIYHKNDDDYDDVPQHHVPHHPNVKGGRLDDDFGEPVTIRRLPPTLAKQGKQSTTTEEFLVEGLPWKIAAWEYFVHFQKVNNSRLLLLWTPWNDDSLWEMHYRRNGGPILRLGTPDAEGNYTDKRACYLGLQKGQISEASAVIFHGPAINLDHMPDKHYPNQYWVYYDIEAPMKLLLKSKSRPLMLNSIGFNLTWSYSKKADILHQYGYFVRRTETTAAKNDAITKRMQKHLADFAKRQYDGLVVPSTCVTQSDRETVVVKLKDYGINIDTLGKCHNTYSPEYLLDTIGHDMYMRYRFYFAFENSRCDYFMTQRIFEAYNASMYYAVIPVVYGAGKSYEELLPKGSFINADDFPSVRQLARHLKQVASYPADKLERFFAWQKDYDINFRYIQAGLRNLCEKIWEFTKETPVTPRTVSDVADTFGECRAPSSSFLGFESEVQIEEPDQTKMAKPIAAAGADLRKK